MVLCINFGEQVMMPDSPLTCLVLSGGLGLGAYHGGAFEQLHRQAIPLDWVAGSSAGAISAALIAGSPPELRVSNLRSFWQADATFGAENSDSSRHGFAWMNSISTHLFGRAGFFYPRLPLPTPRFDGLYDLAPARDRLRELIDFGRLNNGSLRVTIVATDLQSGDPVFFHSQLETIRMDHLLASAGFLPEFGPVLIEDKWLGDGGFSLNAPFDPILEVQRPVHLYIVDLFARDGPVPDGLEAAAERKNDLLFGNQTYQRLRYAVEARRLRAQLEGAAGEDSIYLISYRPGLEEAGPDKSFDLSRTAMTQRWRAGFLDLEHIDPTCARKDGIHVVRRAASK
ncbi:NTE family protein [Nitrobacter vulgaris]|nr:NTE family protein [Nitrobacter vulgaris]